jgi:cell division GTPase FtsZ
VLQASSSTSLVIAQASQLTKRTKLFLLIMEAADEDAEIIFGTVIDDNNG